LRAIHYSTKRAKAKGEEGKDGAAIIDIGYEH